ncbi:hypothetical protein THRCLA_06238 [Thraustotheca clavata]|uniref:Uncharacterized protein n=1 Tax=Thraustotheca clavata TaxID=74557 RepID=A0A1V9ZPZ2_9STRA|nr:hypothetical protein THRCLA_06238 [Thraustotheca clavata]
MSSVLQSPDLLELVFAFQDGWYQEQLDLIMTLELHGLRHLVHSASSQPFPSMDRVVEILSPWIEKHGISAAQRLVRDMAQVGGLLFLHCAHEGNTVLLKSIQEVGNISLGTQQRIVHTAAAAGHVNVLEFLHQNNYSGFTADTMDTAVSHGHLDAVKFLHANRSEGCTTKALDQAIYHGHSDLIDWLYTNRTEGCSHSGLLFAAKKGSPILQRIVEDGRMQLGGSEIIHAARSGHFTLVKYLASLVSTNHIKRALEAATYLGYTEICQYLNTVIS